MNKEFILTFDIDWAPDYVLEDCLKLLAATTRKGTFFATHATKLNQKIIDNGHNLGIHPNFLPNSSHGDDVISIVENCFTFAPNSWCIRTHALFQSSPLLHKIFKTFPQLSLDVSLLMHRSPHAHKCNWEFEGVSFERLLYNWEDDAEFSSYQANAMPNLFYGRLTVFDFHPIHIYLNSSDGSEYRRLKKETNGAPLYDVDEATLKKFINVGIGTRTYFEHILSSDLTCKRIEEL